MRGGRKEGDDRRGPLVSGKGARTGDAGLRSAVGEERGQAGVTRYWAERAEGESWAAALRPVRERVGRAGRGKGGLGRPGLGWAGVLGSGPIGFSFLFYSFPFLFETPLKLFEFKSNLNSTPMHSTK